MCDDCKHRILSALNWRVVLRKFKKYYPLTTGPMETSRLTWRNLFEHRCTRNTISCQIDQNAPS